MKRARIEPRAPTLAERAATDRALLAIVEGPAVIRRSKVERAAPARAAFESGRVRLRPKRPVSEYVWPEPGAIEGLFREARKQRA